MKHLFTVVLVVFCGLAINGFSQQVNPTPQKQEKKTESEKSREGLRKITNNNGVNVEVNVDEVALEKSINIQIEKSMRSVERAMENLEIRLDEIEGIEIEPIYVDVGDIDIDIEPIEVNIGDIDIDIEPIEIEIADINIDMDDFEFDFDWDDDFDNDDDFDVNDDFNFNEDSDRSQGLIKLTEDKEKNKEKNKEKEEREKSKALKQEKDKIKIKDKEEKDKSGKEDKDKSKGLKKIQ